MSLGKAEVVAEVVAEVEAEAEVEVEDHRVSLSLECSEYAIEAHDVKTLFI